MYCFLASSFISFKTKFKFCWVFFSPSNYYDFINEDFVSQMTKVLEELTFSKTSLK